MIKHYKIKKLNAKKSWYGEFINVSQLLVMSL